MWSKHRCSLLSCRLRAVYFIFSIPIYQPRFRPSRHFVPPPLSPAPHFFAFTIPYPSRPPPRTKNLCNPVLVAPGCKNVAASAPVFRIVCSCMHPMYPRHHRQLVNQMQRSHRKVNCSESQVAFEFPPEGL